MSEFKDFQKSFTKGVVDQDLDTALKAGIIPGGKFKEPEEALSLHREGYFARLTEQLGETYEAVWFVLGDEEFFSACREFIGANPSSFYSLSDYGKGFAEYIVAADWSREFPFLPDLARFEWDFKSLFHKAQHTSMPVANLAKELEDTQLRLEFTEAMFLFQSKYPIYQIWSMRKEDPEKQEAIDLASISQLMLYKSDGQIFTKSLPVMSYAILKSLLSGDTLETAFASQESHLTADDVTELFQVIAQTGIVTGSLR